MKKSFLLSSLVVSLLTVGCTVVRELPSYEHPVDKQTESYALSHKLLTAFLKDDAKTFVGLLPPEGQKRFTEKDFATTRKAVVETMGTPISFKYVTTLEMDAFSPQIWKVRFERTGVRKKDETFHSEALFRVITGKTDDNTTVITAFNFL